MTRIGRIICWESHYPANPWFRLVIENGKITLGCWRSVSQEIEQVENYTRPGRTVFERIS